MNRMFLLLFAWLALTIGIAHAAPARPLYEPPDPPKAPQSMLDLRGTTWHGSFFGLSDAEVTFKPDGTWVSRRPHERGDEIGRGSWKATGANLEFDNGYAFYRGTIAGHFIQGESSNINGLRAPFLMQRGPLGR